MSGIITGFHFDKGAGSLAVDAGKSVQMVRPNGDRLAVAIAADGGDAAGRGRQAAQTAVDALLAYLQQGSEPNIPDLLANGMRAANQEVYILSLRDQAARQGKRPELRCSLAAAVIHNDEKLYIANVGNCRVTFVRDSKSSQLSLDHSLKNVAPVQGKMRFETAQTHPNSENLVRFLGTDSKLQVDLGFHVGKTPSEKSYEMAQTRGRKGLPLKPGDSILVCTDGLIKNSADASQPLVLSDEIIQVLTTQEGNKAARGLVSFALGRDAADNVTVAVLQTSDPSRAVKMVNHGRAIRQRTALVFGLLTFFLLACLGSVTWFLWPSGDAVVAAGATPVELADLNGGELGKIGEQPTSDPAHALRATQTVAAILTATEDAQPTATPIPTNTPRPTLQPGQIGVFRTVNQNEFEPVYEDIDYFSGEISEAQINHDGVDDEDASIYSFRKSEMEFSEVDQAVEFRIFELSDIFIHTGLYEDGTSVEVRTADDDIVFTNERDYACMAVSYLNTDFDEPEEELDEVNAFCFSGECSYQIGREDAVEFSVGTKVTFDPLDLDAEPTVRPISQADGINYLSLLVNFEGGLRDIRSCMGSYLPATPTPTATAVIFVASPTPGGVGTTLTPDDLTTTPEPTLVSTSTPFPDVQPTLPVCATSTPPPRPVGDGGSVDDPVPDVETTAEFCVTPTPVATETATKPPAATATSSATATLTLVATVTQTAVAGATSTPRPLPTATPTAVSTTAPTVVIAPTNTPGPSATKTPVPTKTSTPPPRPSGTPLPTLTPLPTHTPFPTKPLPTLTPLPSLTPLPTKPLPTLMPLPTQTPIVIKTVVAPTIVVIPTEEPLPTLDLVVVTLVYQTPTPFVLPTLSLPTPTPFPLVVVTVDLAPTRPLVIPTIEIPIVIITPSP